jgi:hypothetical protein
MGQTIPVMQAMRLLASSGVTMAAGAMISLSFAVSPSLTLLPPRPVPGDVTGNVTSQQQRAIETVGAAIDDTFERRWPAANDYFPPMPAPPRDLLEGLIGGLLPLAQDAPQVMHDLVASPQAEQQESVTAVLQQEPPARPPDVCGRRGLRRVGYTQNHHRHWRCAAGRPG